ncbi:MAG: hypothetical protein GX817_03330 [Elusimicrobia bacterium]|nr:hypothetical protein [Elusimicrobiota bacterium]
MKSALLLSFIGGLFITDATAIGQMMFSRPIFAGSMIGLIGGNLQAGLYIGMIMELVWITVIPMGSAVPPDASVVAIAATAIASSGKIVPSYLVFLVLLLVPFGIVFKKLDMIHREFNVYFSDKTEQKLLEGDTSYIKIAIYQSSFLFFFKGFIFLFILIVLGRLIIPWLYSLIPAKGLLGLNDIFYILPSLGFGTAVTTFIFKKSPNI